MSNQSQQPGQTSQPTTETTAGHNLREEQEAREEKFLSPFACHARQSRGRERAQAPCEIRTEFQRDVDRIVHSKAFRRLKHKTQVFLHPEGDHYRTRMTHTLEVSRIARTIARGLSLNEDLTEAIALGHDLGHTPYGHAGEWVLDNLMTGGFRHNRQSLRVVTLLEEEGAGLNLTWEVRNGIVCHSGNEKAATLEGQVVAIADRMAYINHDIQDALRAKVLYPTDLPLSCIQVLGYTHSERIGRLTTDMIVASQGRGEILQSPLVAEAMLELRKFMFDHVYTNPLAKCEEGKAQDALRQMFHHYCENWQDLPGQYQEIIAKEGRERGVCDYIAGMTDTFAGAEFQRLFVPVGWSKK